MLTAPPVTKMFIFFLKSVLWHHHKSKSWYISMYHKQKSMSKIELDLKRFAAYKKGKFREKINKVTIKCLNLIF